MKFWTVPARVARLFVPSPSADSPPLLLYTDKVTNNGQPIFRSWHPLEGFGDRVPDGDVVFPASQAYFTNYLSRWINFETTPFGPEAFADLAADYVSLPKGFFVVKEIEVTLTSEEEEG